MKGKLRKTELVATFAFSAGSICGLLDVFINNTVFNIISIPLYAISLVAAIIQLKYELRARKRKVSNESNIIK